MKGYCLESQNWGRTACVCFRRPTCAR